MAFDASPKFASEFNIDSQMQLELLFAKNQLIPRIQKEFLEAGAIAMIEDRGIPVEFGLDLLVQLVLHKRAHVAILIGILKKHFDEEECPEQAASDMLLKAAEADLCDIVTRNEVDPITQTYVRRHDAVMVFGISEDVQAELDQFQFPLPMVIEPVKLTHNAQTGYRTIKGSIILKNNHHGDDICLDHINRVNQIPLRLNADVVAFVQNNWKNLDKQKEDETVLDFRKRKEAFAKYDRTAKDVILAMQTQGDRFWLTHRYDKRGRVYSQGYHINYQGSDWNKACIEFADGEPLNQE